MARRRRVGRWEEISHLDQIGEREGEEENEKERRENQNRGKRRKEKGELCVRGRGKREDFQCILIVEARRS